jgi:hypothetical protein
MREPSTAHPWVRTIRAMTCVPLACLLISVLAAGSAPPSVGAGGASSGADTGIARVQASARTAPATAAAAPAPFPAPARFLTTRPGTPLRSDAFCAGAVSSDAETNPENRVYNTVAGDKRLPANFFPPQSGDPRANENLATRVTGGFTGTTPQILEWAACKWGINSNIVRAQAIVESSWRQGMRGDWTTNPDHCAPRHGPGVDGRPHACPESFGILQVRYRFFSGAFPDAVDSTAFNADAAYAVWRACYEGYEWWLQDAAAPGHTYKAGDKWGCIGRWYAGRWYGPIAEPYIDCVQRLFRGREPCA